MKKLYVKALSGISAALLAMCSFSGVPLHAADTTEAPAEVAISFDFEGEGIAIAADKNGNVPELTELTGTPGSSVELPKVQLEKSGYTFQGWTYDDVRGYKPGEVMQFPDADITMKAVFMCDDYKESHTLTYLVEETDIAVDRSQLPRKFYAPEGKFISLSLFSIDRDGYCHVGWDVGDRYFLGEQCIIMHDEDIVVRPHWMQMRKLIYTVGDADRIVGATYMEYENYETMFTNLQSNTRFSRRGFKLTGWLCDYDGQIYPCDYYYTMPKADVTMTPVWEPINYKLLFNPMSGSSADIIRVPGTTDTTITIPECSVTKEGYTFKGWEFEGKLYQPGEEYLVEGTTPGLGYTFIGKWAKAGEIETTTAAVTTAPVTASVTADATSNCCIVLGDANLDGELNLADSVRIMQAVTAPDKYALSDEETAAADVDGGGVTNKDALIIQKFLLGLIESLSAQ